MKYLQYLFQSLPLRKYATDILGNLVCDISLWKCYPLSMFVSLRRC